MKFILSGQQTGSFIAATQMLNAFFNDEQKYKITFSVVISEKLPHCGLLRANRK